MVQKISNLLRFENGFEIRNLHHFVSKKVPQTILQIPIVSEKVSPDVLKVEKLSGKKYLKNLPGHASTGVIVNTIQTIATIHTTTTGTIVIISLAFHSRKSYRTTTCVRIDVLVASCSILARMRLAFINIDFASLSGKTITAQTREISNFIETRTAILTWKTSTIIFINGTILTFVA